MTYETARLAEVMTAVLDGVVAHFADLGITLPTRRYTTVGIPAVDCEQLVVHLQRMFAGTAGLERQDPLLCAGQRVAEIAVEIQRCVAVVDDSGEPPSLTVLTADGATLITDAWVTRRAVEALASPGGEGYQMSVLETRPIDPTGGFAGSQLLMQVEL